MGKNRFSKVEQNDNRGKFLFDKIHVFISKKINRG